MKNRWNSRGKGIEGLASMVFASRLIGADSSLVLWGGGNTSIKVEEIDFRGHRTRVLRVKGSGSDLKSMEPHHFAGVRLDDVLPLMRRDTMTDDDMVSYVTHCLMSAKDPRPSIEVLLHACIPHAAVIHTHADAILSLTNTPRGREIVKRVYGDSVGWVPYQIPGFTLSKTVGTLMEERPSLRAIILEKHGLITWGATSKDAYLSTVAMVSAAEAHLAKALRKMKRPFGPSRVPPGSRIRGGDDLVARLAIGLRGAWGGDKRIIVHFDGSADVMAFVGSAKAKALAMVGPGTPDHLMSIKRMPMWLDLPKKFHHTTSPSPLAGEGGMRGSKDEVSLHRSVETAVTSYRRQYGGYAKRFSNGHIPPVDHTPRVILVPGVGMYTTGKDIRTARIAGEIYHHTIAIMRAAQALGGYRSVSDRHAHGVEFWPMELYKQTLAPPEQECSRRVVLVTGAASGIGKAIAYRFAEEGAHVVIADIDNRGAAHAAQELCERWNMERAIAVTMDVSNEASVAKGFAAAATMYGGVDVIVSNAGVAHSAPVEHMRLVEWELDFKVNSTGHFLVSREAVRLLRRQGLGGSIIFIASKNVLAPGKNFAAYSASKAAETQLARIVAIENGPHGIRVNIVNPDAVFQDSKLWSPDVRAEQAEAQGIAAGQIEEHYRQRSLLKKVVEPRDVAEAVMFLASDRASKTTGCMFPVDAGIREAFAR